ncbi:MAG: hypothetical protein KDI63_08605 [Gammaproteobacteria bacterium]|nr:hypothetical protein [Gammaproteobacteria bacterium]
MKKANTKSQVILLSLTLAALAAAAFINPAAATQLQDIFAGGIDSSSIELLANRIGGDYVV